MRINLNADYILVLRRLAEVRRGTYAEIMDVVRVGGLPKWSSYGIVRTANGEHCLTAMRPIAHQAGKGTPK